MLKFCINLCSSDIPHGTASFLLGRRTKSLRHETVAAGKTLAEGMGWFISTTKCPLLAAFYGRGCPSRPERAVL